MPSTNTPYMSLILPTVGQEPGPTWAYDLNSNSTILDSHDHSSGSGVQITPAGINISSDLTFNNHNATALRSARFTVQGSPISLGTDLGCLYVSGVDLYYNDENGNQIRMTQGGGVAGTPGSIGTLTPPASVFYQSFNQTFYFQSNVNTAANVDIGAVTLHEVVANSNGVALQSPPSLAASYTVTLPAGTPPAGTPSALAMSSTGALTTVQGGVMPTGVVLPYGGASSPAGYLICDGTAVSRTTYAALFAVVSTSFGVGDGSTTFNVPNMRRSVPMGAGGSPSSTISNTVGSVGGEENHVLLLTESAPHTHKLLVNASSNQFPVADNTGSGISLNQGGFGGQFEGVNQPAGYGFSNSQGNGNGHNTVQPAVIYNFIIKT